MIYRAVRPHGMLPLDADEHTLWQLAAYLGVDEVDDVPEDPDAGMPMPRRKGQSRRLVAID